MSADRQIASFIAAVERKDLKAARWIYAGLDPQAQRQADLILVGKIAHHEDQAGLALERQRFSLTARPRLRRPRLAEHAACRPDSVERVGLAGRAALPSQPADLDDPLAAAGEETGES